MELVGTFQGIEVWESDKCPADKLCILSSEAFLIEDSVMVQAINDEAGSND